MISGGSSSGESLVKGGVVGGGGAAIQIALVNNIVQEAVISNLRALEQQQQLTAAADGTMAAPKQLVEIALSRTGRLSARISSSSIMSSSSIDHHGTVGGDDELSAGLQRLRPVLSLIHCNASSSWRTTTADTGEQQRVDPSGYWTSKRVLLLLLLLF